MNAPAVTKKKKRLGEELIEKGLVTYDHDGSQTSSDSFDISLADGGEDGATAATGMPALARSTSARISAALWYRCSRSFASAVSTTANPIVRCMVFLPRPADAAVGRGMAHAPERDRSLRVRAGPRAAPRAHGAGGDS